MKSIAAIFMLILAFGLVFNSLNSEPVKNTVALFPAINLELQTGDLVFRRGKGFISDFFAQASEYEKLYSHVGVVVIKHGSPYVFHIIGNVQNGNKGLKMESLTSFCDGTQNSAFAIYRNGNLGGKQVEVENYLEAIKKNKIVFDEHFDLVTDDAQYCTEMIYKMFASVTGKQLSLSKFNEQSFVAVDNLYHHIPECHLILNHTYLPNP